jgi:hypothetical protein
MSLAFVRRAGFLAWLAAQTIAALAALAALAVLTTLCALAATSALAATPMVTATIQPTQIVLGESAELTITHSGGSNEPVSLPAVAGLAFRVIGTSQRTEIIRGATFSSTALVVRVTPAAAGVYTIPALTPDSQPLVLRVRPEGSLPLPGHLGATGGKAPDLSKAADGAAFLRLVLPKTELYVGESIPVAIELKLKNGFVKSLNGLPKLNGADFTLNNLSRQPERSEKVIDGEGFTVLTWRSMLGGVKPGSYSLSVESPVTIRVQTRPQGESRLENMLGDPFLQNIFGATVTKEVTLKSTPADLTVLELPAAGRPSGFSGAVGSFKIADELSPSSAAAGDPLTVRLRITGTGNFDRVDSPMLTHLDGWKTYPPTSSFKAGDELGEKGEKTFEQPIIAARTGAQTLPELTFSYFDPSTRSYQTARSGALSVTISASQADRSLSAPTVGSSTPNSAAGAPPSAAAIGTSGVTPVARDALRPDHVGADAVYASLTPLYLRPHFLAVPTMLTLSFACGWLVSRRGTAAGVGRRRRERRLSKALQRRLLELDTAAHAGDAARFFSLARGALNLPVGTDLSGESNEVRELVALADEATYSGHAITVIDFEHWRQVVHRRLLGSDGP